MARPGVTRMEAVSPTAKPSHPGYLFWLFCLSNTAARTSKLASPFPPGESLTLSTLEAPNDIATQFQCRKVYSSVEADA